MGRVRSDGADTADRSGARDHRQLQQILPRAAKNLVRVGQNPGRYDIDDDLTGTQHQVGQDSALKLAIYTPVGGNPIKD
jgi:hypothetical protein